MNVLFLQSTLQVRSLNITTRCSSGILLFITVFESRNWDVCDNILVLLHRLLEIYDCLVTRYSEVQCSQPLFANPLTGPTIHHGEYGMAGVIDGKLIQFQRA